MSKGAMDKRNLEAEIDRLAIAAKALKLAVEQANWLLWTDRERAERILMQALKRPTMSALTKWGSSERWCRPSGGPRWL